MRPWLDIFTKLRGREVESKILSQITRLPPQGYILMMPCIGLNAMLNFTRVTIYYNTFCVYEVVHLNGCVISTCYQLLGKFSIHFMITWSHENHCAVRQQAITWSNTDQDLSRHIASPDYNELIPTMNSQWPCGYYIHNVFYLCRCRGCMACRIIFDGIIMGIDCNMIYAHGHWIIHADNAKCVSFLIGI